MANVIRTPDQRLRVFVSSTLGELAAERRAARDAIERMRLVPVMFELGARPHPPRELYRAYLAQSHVFVGIYWQRYGWVAPGEEVSGLEDEYRLAGDRPRLLYLKEPAPDREPRLDELLGDLKADDRASYKRFETPEELAALIEQDLAVLLTERFEATAQQPQATLAATPARAPVPLTPTIGRERDLASITDLLARGARLLTLTGVGGIGKTRLAVQAAQALADRYEGRVSFVALDSVTDPGTVLATIAERLHARAVGTLSHLDALAEVLAGPPSLLILDNFEQLVEAAPSLGALLQRCPGLQLLVTSRQALRAAGEHEYPVSPLAQSSPTARLTEAAAAPAVQLFVERARAVKPGFSLTPDNVDDVVTLCHLLDGLPLAIELAAARLSLLSPGQLRERLSGCLDLLVGGRDRPQRQRTLRATIDWSHDLLDEDAQALFARLSVFAGGFTLEAAEEVCDLGDGPPVLEGVAGLLDRSLLVAVDDHEVPYFRMLETVRSYAAEQLELRGEVDVMRDRHLDWYRRFTDRAQPFLCGPRQLQWSARVDPERGNLRAAVEHALSRGDAATVVAMAWDVYVYYALRGAPDEPAGWMARAAEHRDRLDEQANAVLETAFAIGEAWHGDHSNGRARLLPALEVFEKHDMVLEQAVAHMYLGLVHLAEGDLRAATAAEAAACEAFEAIDHDWGAASSQAILGMVQWVRDDLDGARRHYQASLGFAERIANEQLSGQAHVGLATCALSERRPDEARRHLERAVPLLQRCRDAVAASTCLDVLAVAALAEGRPDTAATALAVADGTRRRLGLPLHPALQARVDAVASRVRGQLGAEFAETWQRGGDLDPLRSLEDALAALR